MSIPVPAVVETMPLEYQEVFRYLCREMETDQTTEETTINQTTGETFTDRGDPASVDFDENDLTMDNTWNDLDLSSIIDSGASLVLLRVYYDKATEATLEFRENGNSNTANASRLMTIGEQRYGYGDCFVVPDSSGVIEYKASAAFNDVEITVGGWWA